MKMSDFVIENGWLNKYLGKEEYIEIPDTVTAIADFAFAENKTIKSVVMPNSILEMTNGIFAKCESLESVIFSDFVTKIGSFTFHGCINLTEVKLPKNLRSIYRLAFGECKRLSELVLPDGISHISANAFEGCSSLAKIELPSSVKEVLDRAFANCTNLREVSVLDDNIYFGCSLFDGASPNIKIEYSGVSDTFLKMIFNEKRQPTPWLTIGKTVSYKPITMGEQQFIYDSKNTFCIEVFCKKDGKCLTFRNNKK